MVLDVGCGPGTITAGLARRASRVVGLDMSADMVAEARRHAADCGLDNASFQVGSAYDLPWDGDSFDVVYAHQVLQHLSDPVRALREARRVLRPGGLVAVRDSDYGTMVHAPVFTGHRALAGPLPPGSDGQRRRGRRRTVSAAVGDRCRLHRPRDHCQHHRQR